VQYLVWSTIEQCLLRHARLKLFVSKEMRCNLGDICQHGSRSIIMPCYNSSLQPKAFNRPNRYCRLDLVYAGSMHRWQCVEDVLLTFKLLHVTQPQTTLTLFTREIDRAKTMCSTAGLTNVRIESVTPEKLLTALCAFSYGFILREHMDINEVSTPTKFNTYLAAGVIPVVTTATPALVRMLEVSPYKVVVTQAKSHAEIAEALTALAETAPLIDRVQDSYTMVFARHFDDNIHAMQIAQAMIEEA